MTIALAAGAVGWQFGQRAVFLLVPVFATLAAAAALSILAAAIDSSVRPRRATTACRGPEIGGAHPRRKPCTRSVRARRAAVSFCQCAAPAARRAGAALAVQPFDGIGAGIWGVLAPLVVADLTANSGRYNLALGAVATTQGAGRFLSGLAAGLIVDHLGRAAAFLTSAGVASAALALVGLALPETRRRDE